MGVLAILGVLGLAGWACWSYANQLPAYSPPKVAMPVPNAASFRALARVLVAEGKLAEREGRMPDAARSYLDCLHLGTDVPRGGVLIHGLVGLAVQALGLRAMEGAVDRLDGPTAAAAAR